MKKILINIATFFLMVSILSSCKMGKDYEAPVVDTPLEYRFGTDTVITTEIDTMMDWSMLIQDPILDTLIATALRNNQDVKIAMQRIIEAEKLYRIQRVNARPMLGYSGNYQYGNYNNMNVGDQQGVYFGGSNLNWEIDLWGKNKRLSEAAKADYMSSVYGLHAAQITLVASVSEYYIELLENQASLQVAERTLASRDSSMVIMDARFEKGAIPEIDLNQAQIQQAIAESAVPVYKRGIVLAENTLSILLGENPRAVVTGLSLTEQVVPQAIPSGIPSELLKRRPDVMQSEEAIIAQNAQVGAAIANRFPSISITGTGGIASAALSSANLTQGAWNIGAGIVGPLFEWGRNKRKIEVEKARLETAILHYEKDVRQSFKEVEDALASIQYYSEEELARQKHVTAARSAEFLSKERYDKGVTSYLEYLEQQRSSFDAQLKYVEVKSDILKSYVQLYKALGGGWTETKK